MSHLSYKHIQLHNLEIQLKTYSITKFASSFDRAAEAYELYRPRYPDVFFKEIFQKVGMGSNPRILEIGCGTGKATESFKSLDCILTAIDPGANLIKIASKKFSNSPHINFICSPFEKYVCAEKFDLVFAAESFHWLEPNTRLKKISGLLKNDAAISIIWNKHIWEDSVFIRGLHEIFAQSLPEFKDALCLKNLEEEINHQKTELINSKLFHDIQVIRYRWHQTCSADEFIGMISTYSYILEASEKERQQLFTYIHELINSCGGKIMKPYESLAFIGKKVKSN